MLYVRAEWCSCGQPSASNPPANSRAAFRTNAGASKIVICSLYPPSCRPPPGSRAAFCPALPQDHAFCGARCRARSSTAMPPVAKQPRCIAHCRRRQLPSLFTPQLRHNVQYQPAECIKMPVDSSPIAVIASNRQPSQLSGALPSQVRHQVQHHQHNYSYRPVS